jgi:hypothetical protein
VGGAEGSEKSSSQHGSQEAERKRERERDRESLSWGLYGMVLPAFREGLPLS